MFFYQSRGFVSFLGGLLLASFSFTQAQTNVAVLPVSKNAAPSGWFTISINVSNVTDLHASSVKIAHNKNVLHLTDSLYTLGSFWNGFFVAPLPPSITSGPEYDTMSVDLAILGTGSRTGSGTLFTLNYTGSQNGTTPVILTSVILRNSSNATIPSSKTDGQVIVSNPPVTYVDQSYTPSNQGGHDFGFDGFNVLANGVNAVAVAGIVNVAPGVYNETVLFSRDVTITPMSGIPVIQHITLSSNSVSLGGGFQVNGALTLSNGKMVLGSHTLTMGPAATTSGASSNGFIVTNGTGKLVRQGVGTSPVPFPIGSSPTSFNPVTIATGSGTDNFAVRVLGSVFPVIATEGKAVQRSWDISEETPGGNGSLTFSVQWNAAHEGPDFSRAIAVPWRHTGTAWVMDGSLTGPISGGDPYVATVLTTGLSYWTIANDDAALPIQLASFTGTVTSGRNIRLTWVTVSEINNYGFFVQRKRPAEQGYVEVPGSFVAGHGTTNEPHTYTFTDIAPGTGVWQYRLKQVDLDGSIYYTEPIEVDVLTNVSGENAPLTFSLGQNYPNPFNPATTIEFELPKAGYATLKIFNLLGEEVSSLVDGLVEAGRHTIQWNAASLPSSVYLYKLTAGGAVETRRLVLMK